LETETNVVDWFMKKSATAPLATKVDKALPV
jgi:hypothetical protein